MSSTVRLSYSGVDRAVSELATQLQYKPSIASKIRESSSSPQSVMVNDRGRNLGRRLAQLGVGTRYKQS